VTLQDKSIELRHRLAKHWRGQESIEGGDPGRGLVSDLFEEDKFASRVDEVAAPSRR